MEPRFYFLKRLAPAFVPKYFLISISFLYQALRCRGVELACNKDTAFPPSLDLFEQSCRMTSFQVYGCVESTGLFPIEYPFDLLPPGTSASSIVRMRAGSLAAGLPHFSTHHMRSWGRDVFISLRGLFLIPGHFKEARAHLIAFGSTLRHGLIPNLLDQGIRPRYNARDATWWWLWSVAEYCRMSPEGYKFLKVLVGRRFVPLKRYTNGPGYGKDVPESDEHPHADTYISPEDSLVYKYKNTVAELCHEVLERHARGIKFREWNAGPNLDHAMSSEGFNVSVSTDWDNGTGFAQGGNQYNCGTWMDKMGDSEKARTKGVPATPRDGADIEIVGLQKAVLRWISDEVLRLSDHESYWSRSGVQSIQRGTIRLCVGLML